MTYLWAPAPYRWTDLLNSDSWDHRGSGNRVDRLQVDDWLETFLELCGWKAGRLPDAAGRARLRRLRAVVARLVAAIVTNGKPEKRDLEALNRHLRLASAHPQVDLVGGEFAIREAPSSRGLAGVIGFLARNLAETLANGELERIKVCANPDCHWVMYDESRNRTRRWCEAAACGNLVKVRQYRERRSRRGTTR